MRVEDGQGSVSRLEDSLNRVGRLNYFETYRRSHAGYEKSLNRAFLVLLRLVPPAHDEFVALVRSEQRRLGYNVLVPRLVDAIVEVEVAAETSELGIESGTIISALLTDEPYEPLRPVRARRGRYFLDGRLVYGDIALILEDKLNHNQVSAVQLDIPVPEGSEEIDFEDKPPLVIAWRDIIKALHALREREMLGATARRLVADFLDYVEAYHDRLNPFSTVRLCGQSASRLGRRSAMLLREIGPAERVHVAGAPYLDLGPGSARRAYLSAKTDGDVAVGLQLAIYPADTVSQARRFYGTNNLPARLKRLQAGGFAVNPNLHLHALNNRLLDCSEVSNGLDDYVSFWMQENASLIRRVVGKQAILKCLRRLEAEAQIPAGDAAQVADYYERTKADRLDVCPGLRVTYTWPLEEAGDLDDQGALSGEIRARIQQALRCWDQTMPTEEISSH